MKEGILLGRQNIILEVPAGHWRNHLANVGEHSSERLSFMTGDHHQVRNFVVRELPRNDGKPLSAQDISSRLHLSLSRVRSILEDLQEHLFFLVLNEAGEVSWAFPVTCEQTPHRLSFNTGEHVFAAWAEDAIATPFVQGRLRDEKLSVKIETECKHCGQELQLTLDSDLNWNIQEPEAQPLVFEPDVDWQHFKEPTIIHRYWQNSVFFWSEEHAREYRKSHQQANGVYLTLEQSAYATKIAQSALFGFEQETE